MSERDYINPLFYFFSPNHSNPKNSQENNSEYLKSSKVISGSRHVEETYRMLETAVEQSIDGIAVADMNGIIRFCNQAWAKMHGYQIYELLGKHLSIFHTKEQMQRDVIPFNEQVKSSGAHHGEVGHVRRDGTPFVTWMSTTLLKDKEERPIGLVGIARDITEQKWTKETLMASEEKYRKLFESSIEGIGISKGNRVITANKAVLDIFGYDSLEELIKVPLLDHVALESRDMIGERMIKRQNGGYVTPRFEYKIICKDGQIKDIEASSVEFSLAGEKYVQTTFRDITERKKVESQLTKINNCLLNFGTDPDKNINNLVILCGEIMAATTALYSRIKQGIIHSIGVWNMPQDYKSMDKADGHICYDMVKLDKNEFYIVRNLLESPYALTDPNVVKYQLKTYIGLPVKFESETMGALCVVYQKDFVPDEDDKKFMQIIASAIAIEEKRRQSQEKIRENWEKYKTLTENINVGIYRVTAGAEGRFIEVNPALIKMFGYDSKDELFSKTVCDLYQNPKEREKFSNKLSKDGFVRNEELLLKKKDNSSIIGSVSAVAVKDENDQVKFYDGVVEDISERKNTEKILIEKERFLSSVFDSIQDGISILDKEMRIVQVNGAIEKWYQHAMPLVGKKCYEAYHGRLKQCDICPTQRTFQTGKSANEVVPKIGKDGNVVGWLDLYTFPLIDTQTNQIKGIIEYVRDITERKLAEGKSEKLNKELFRTNRRLRHLVLRDSHTGLYNHRYLQEAIESEFYRAKKYEWPLSVIMLDLDYFESINDVYSHQFGDLVLKQFAHKLKIMVRREDTVIRCGGEEFIIISSGMNKSMALALANRIFEDISLCNFGNKEQSIKLKLSIGVVSYPEDKVAKGMDLVELVDRILNRAKEDGGDRVYSYIDIKKEKHIPEVSKEKVDVKFLKRKIERLNKRANQNLIESVFAFAKTIKLKDHYTGDHVENTVYFATEIAKKICLPREEVEHIRRAAMVHDLGKIGVSEKILLKKSKLTKREFIEIKKHPQIGADILRSIHFFQNIIPLIQYHHERWDGKGYPHGLKREEIPMGARIVAIADAYQALISDRPYRKAYSKNKAKEIINAGSGYQFDPKIVDVFLKVLQR